MILIMTKKRMSDVDDIKYGCMKTYLVPEEIKKNRRKLEVIEGEEFKFAKFSRMI